jgi:alkylation response protein AidB-like acyl-CoA dehydrogenase
VREGAVGENARGSLAPGRGGDIVQTATRIAEEVLFPAALATDAADAVPVEHLDLLAEAGLYGLAGPEEEGGLNADSATVLSVVETLAGACLTTTFVWAQHHGLVRALAMSPPSRLRDEWLGPLCRGERRAGLALGGLLPGPPRLQARPSADGHGWIVDGTSPWVTGWGRIDVLLIAARGPGDTLVWLLADAVDGPGLAAGRQRLVAADASVTVQLDFAGLELPGERLIAIAPYTESMYSMGDVLRQNGSLALGVAGRCCRLMGPSPLDDDLVACRQLLDGADANAMPTARAAASELAMRAAAVLVVAAGSRSILRDQHPQRLAREALFLLVFGSRPGIRSSLLERLNGRASP